MKIFKELNKLGYKHYTEHTVEELDKLPLESKERVMEQALVLKWFREKYNLISSVAAIYKDETRTDFEFWYYILQEVEEEELFYETYEEAELECIKKLIKLCKKN
jgi:hypothetical protein